MDVPAPPSSRGAGLRAGFLVCAAVVALSTSAAAQEPLRFVGDRDYPPLSSVDHGEPAGFDVDVIRAIAERLGRDVRIDLMEWADAQRAVQQGEASGLTDLAIFGRAPRPLRLRGVHAHPRLRPLRPGRGRGERHGDRAARESRWP